MTRIRWTKEWARTRSIPPDPQDIPTHGYYSNLNIWQALMEAQSDLERLQEENDRLNQENKVLKQSLRQASAPLAKKMTQIVSTIIASIVSDAYSNRSELEQQKIALSYFDRVTQRLDVIADLQKIFRES